MSLFSRVLPILLAASAFAEITVYHTVTSVPKGTTRQFTAYVPYSPNGVVWSVNGLVGGSANGTVSATAFVPEAIVTVNNLRFATTPIQ